MELKTLKDLEAVQVKLSKELSGIAMPGMVSTHELRQEAIKWAKSKDDEYWRGAFKEFFNITEADLK